MKKKAIGDSKKKKRKKQLKLNNIGGQTNMADFSEKWGTDVDTGRGLALEDLNLTIR